MLNIDAYNDAISATWKHIILDLLPLFVYWALLIFIGVVGMIKKFFKKSRCFLVLLLSVVTLFYACAEILVFKHDIENENFEVYYGEFEYKKFNRRGEYTLNFKGESNLRILHIRSVADLSITSGTHCGYVLYGQNSRWAIAYSTTPFE